MELPRAYKLLFVLLLLGGSFILSQLHELNLSQGKSAPSGMAARLLSLEGDVASLNASSADAQAQILQLVHTISRLKAVSPGQSKPEEEAIHVARMIETVSASYLAEREQVYSQGQRTRGILCAHGALCKGSDRMLSDHTYGPCYSEFLNKMRPGWLKREASHFLIGEIGILSGTGLAMWSDVFPNADIYGFDYVINNTAGNLALLGSRGAFRHSNLSLHTYDQHGSVAVNSQMIGAILGSNRFTFFVDDGLHTDNAIVDTFLAFKDYMSSGGLYVIEDVAPPAKLKCERVFKKCVERAKAVFGPVVQKHGWKMHSCEYDARWYAFTRNTTTE